MVITLTPTSIINSTILFGIIHLIYWSVKRFSVYALKEIGEERAKIIRRHKKDGHESRLKYCDHPDCEGLTVS
jgi:hypothetical protein